MIFYGNQICCGSYACLNALRDSSLELSLFELSTGVPFGIRHVENGAFDRLLTTFHDPNEGLDEALRLWGCRVSKLQAGSGREAAAVLRAWPEEWERVVLGPVDMGALGYQPAPALLRRMDHYIVLERGSESALLCTDSEGFQDLRVSFRQLETWISAEGLPEARGKVTLRAVTRERPCGRAEILAAALRAGAVNLNQAERAGQGSGAVRACLDCLEASNIVHWRLPFLYDLAYLHQRKRLQEHLFTLLERDGLLAKNETPPLHALAAAQISLLGTAYASLYWENALQREALLEMADLEQTLAGHMARWGEAGGVV